VAAKTSGSLQLDSISVNCDGSMVCALASLPGSGGCQDPRLFAYSAGRNGPLVLDMSPDMTAPRAVAWDLSDPRLLAVQTGALVRSQAGSRPNSGDGSSAAAGSVGGAAPAGRAATDTGSSDLLARSSDVATVFATDDAGLLLQEYQDLDPASSGCVGFLGVSAPHLLLLKGSAAGQARSASTTSSSILATVPLRCFSGLTDADASTRRALLDFNFLLAVGKLEEAFRVVSALKSPAVWRNMAHMAIKNKQLAVAGEPEAESPMQRLVGADRARRGGKPAIGQPPCCVAVCGSSSRRPAMLLTHAEHCLGNMRHIRGARALRESGALPELDARVGLVAVQLGLTDDAVRLFGGCERWDLLEQLQQASGSWQEALQVASKHDR
jgi:intraflagellar transport protein 140